ncbi:collagen alpha-2(I) chain-like [Hyaena hyaena]|uniref:collagen alpha-2(I) chain-like n=1 Tax=Hyaena hyaena TaxID=95912 RepID=UPI001921B300|nr:collagen alpha-2(I) chain-like [Hyaena hyaena]
MTQREKGNGGPRKSGEGQTAEAGFPASGQTRTPQCGASNDSSLRKPFLELAQTLGGDAPEEASTGRKGRRGEARREARGRRRVPPGRGRRPGGDLGAAGRRGRVTFRRGQLKEARARSTVPPPPALEAALARTAANTAPGIPAGLVPGRNAALASSASGPRAAASARTHPRRPGGRSLSRGGPGGRRSPAPQAEPGAGGLGGSAPRGAEGRVRRAAAEPGRQEEEEDSERSALWRPTLLLAALQQPPQITSGAPGGGAGPAGTHFRPRAPRSELGAEAGEQWPGGRVPSAGCAALGTAPPPLPAPGEVESPPGGPGAAGRFPDLGAGAAPPLSLFWGRGGRGVVGEGGRAAAAILLPGGRPLLPGVFHGGAGDVARREPSPCGGSVTPCPGRSVSVTAGPWGTLPADGAGGPDTAALASRVAPPPHGGPIVSFGGFS